MRVALFVTCVNDALYPRTGIAVVRLLERLGVTVDFPAAQSCCGQPQYNTGYRREAEPLVRRTAEAFAGYAYVVTPSGSCAAMIRAHYPRIGHAAEAEGRGPALAALAEDLVPRVYELTEFLVDVLGVTDVGAYFPHTVTYHPSRVAETGTMVVFESEGNGRMCLTLPETLISVVGIEKVVPAFRDLEIFLQTLPRSSTAERMNPYTTMWTGTTDADGPSVFHLVLLDNGRTDTLADEVGRQALRCIRCSACLNVCPVYERAGGHAYGSVYPGPIGAILSPQLRGTASEIDATLPYASTLCGACYEVCPVAIDIPEVLVHLRERVAQGGPVTREGVRVSIRPADGHTAQRAAMRAARLLLDHPGALRAGERLLARARRLRPRRLPGPGRAWTDSRELPELPERSFRDWWAAREREARP
ncbi:LUD domain-containing protein [Streptomyces sp. H27-H1]|uniref:heterodisulfide reductase-related iron-sulfur binding cluster n=1 Tax=Streptomyces sp. H27-H1 TaxID=2996461 RepID=UPI00226D4C77|nr:LUD domain-containing protein [Streptomyces sp. H27-H1]MCY0928607.1 LUD domain-containing protein [Streptomyces sp. H27-H1]